MATTVELRDEDPKRADDADHAVISDACRLSVLLNQPLMWLVGRSKPHHLTPARADVIGVK